VIFSSHISHINTSISSGDGSSTDFGKRRNLALLKPKQQPSSGLMPAPLTSSVASSRGHSDLWMLVVRDYQEMQQLGQ
jgi:hypothetical protein